MKVEIWSDVMCPFCYIGKRKFEKALSGFQGKEDIEITWKSFQLDPEAKTDPSLNTIAHLAERKGWSQEQARQTTAHVTDMARQVGLDFHFEKAVVANSFTAHRLSHLAKAKGRQNELEERLFAAYFTEGKNTDDHDTLLEIGLASGLDKQEVEALLASDQYSDQVRQDIHEAQQIGVRGVPFFVLDRKYAVSGAQEPATFVQALNRAYDEHLKAKKPGIIQDGSSADACGPDGCAI